MLYYQFDVMMNGVILLVLGLFWYGWYCVDVLFVLGIGIYILYSVLCMGYEVVQLLLDCVLFDEEWQEIIDIVIFWLGVSGVYDFCMWQLGLICFIQIYLEMEDFLFLVQVYMVVDQVDQVILWCFLGLDVIIYQDFCFVVFREGKWFMFL